MRPEQIAGVAKPQKPDVSTWIAEMLWDVNRWGAMAGYIPQRGELVGMMVVAGSTRSDDTTPVEERTRVVAFRWPGAGGGVVTPLWTEGEDVTPKPEPDPEPEPEPSALVPVLFLPATVSMRDGALLALPDGGVVLATAGPAGWRYVSVQPDGRIEARDAIGPWERATRVSPGLLRYDGTGTTYHLCVFPHAPP